MKKIIVLILIFISVFIIYFNLKDNKIYYLSLGDSMSINDDNNYSVFVKDYLEEKNLLENYISMNNMDYRLIDLINDIKDNITINDITIQNALIKADIVTFTIGYNDILPKIYKYDNNKYIDEYLSNLEELYILLRSYCKEKIIMVGYYNIYNTDKYNHQINYLNYMVKELSKKYMIDYIDIVDMVNYTKELRLTPEGQHIIFNRIRDIVVKF